jgi:hypothetical protein
MRKIGFRREKIRVRWDSDGFFNGLSVINLALALIITIFNLIFFPGSWKTFWGAVALPGILGVVFGILYFTIERKNEKSRF